MPRPFIMRQVGSSPVAAVFKPAGVPAASLRWVRMTLDEYEAVRLIDGEGLDQAAAAARMGVSRPTVTRIIGRARAKVAHVLSFGAALAIEGGPVIGPPAAPGMTPRGRRWTGPAAGPPGGGRGFGRGRGRRGYRGGRGPNG